MGAITSNSNRAHRHVTRRFENTQSLLAGYNIVQRREMVDLTVINTQECYCNITIIFSLSCHHSHGTPLAQTT